MIMWLPTRVQSHLWVWVWVMGGRSNCFRWVLQISYYDARHKKTDTDFELRWASILLQSSFIYEHSEHVLAVAYCARHCRAWGGPAYNRLFKIWVFWLHRSYSIKVSVIPKEGYARPSFFWYENDKDLKVCFLVTQLICHLTREICQAKTGLFI